MDTIVEVQHLKKYFRTARGMLHAVDDVSFSIPRGKTLGIVGESGCGKTTLGRTLVHLENSTEGRILFEGEDVTNLDKKGLYHLRQNVQMIFQDPYSSIDPRMTVSETIMEALLLTKRYKRSEAEERTKELMGGGGRSLR